jgi:hypothetical protein
VVQRHRPAGGQRGHHRRGTGRLDTQHRRVRRPLGQVGGDACDTAAAAHRDHHQVRLIVELSKHFDGDGALAGDGAQVVIRRYQGGTGAFDVGQRRLSCEIVGRPPHDQLDEVPAVITDSVKLLFGRLGGHIDTAMHTQRPARICKALRVVTGRRAHHPCGHLLIGQLHQQVVGPAQLVGAHRLQVFAFEVDLRAGDRGQPIAVLQWGGRDHRGNPPRRAVNVSRGQR